MNKNNMSEDQNMILSDTEDEEEEVVVKKLPEGEQIFNTLTLYEQASRTRIKNLRSANMDIVATEEKNKLDKYGKLHRDGHGFRIDYQMPTFKDYGRVKTVPYTGLGTFCREVRAFLADGVYIDIDMVNCHPVILYHEFKRLGLDSTIIGEYVNSREEFLKSENICKTDFLLMINKADFEGKGRIKELHKLIYKSLYPIVLAEHPEIKPTKDYNKRGQFVANYLQTIEFRMLTVLYNYCQKNEILIDVLMHDGCFIRITDKVTEDYINKNFVDNNKFTNLMIEKFGINMKFKVKPHENTLKEKIENDLQGKSDPTYVQMKRQFEKTHCKIMKKSFFIEEENNTFTIYTPRSFHSTYNHFKCLYPSGKDGEDKLVKFIDKWVEDPDMRVYKDIDCYPNNDLCPKDIFNTWAKFEMERVTEYVHHEDGLQAVLDHILVLCGNEEIVYNYMLKWIGHTIKYPELKSGICPTFISNQGAGKGTFIQLLKKMLGDKKVFETADPSLHVWGNFNSGMVDSFIVNLNELSKRDTFSSEGKIKALITDNSLIINTKGISAYKITSFHRFIITTNNYEPVNTSTDDRRNLIIRSSDEKCGDSAYFSNLYKLLEDTDVVKTCYEYFKNLPDLDSFYSLKPPMTEHQSQLIEARECPVLHWLKDLCSNYTSEDEVLKLPCLEVLGNFQSHCYDHGFKFETNTRNLGTMIGYKRIPGISNSCTTIEGKSVRIKIFNKAMMRKHFNIVTTVD